MKHQLLFALAQYIMDGFTAHKTLIAFIGISFAAGLIAQLVMPGKGHGLVLTFIVGIAGCYLSNMFLVKYITFVDNSVAKEFIGAVVAAAVITLAINLVRGPQRQKAR